MIYYTGDIHSYKFEIVRFCKRFKPTRDDTIIILGDVGANYFGDEMDAQLKKEFARLKPTIGLVSAATDTTDDELPEDLAEEQEEQNEITMKM